MEDSWYVAVTASRAEQAVSDALLKRGVVSFIPRVRALLKVEVAFPRYVFIRPGRRGWDAVKAPGITGILGGQVPMAVPARVMREMTSRFGPSGILSIAPVEAPRFKQGDRVAVRSGPLSGLEGLVDKTGPQRVKVLFALMRGTVPVSVPAGDLRFA